MSNVNKFLNVNDNKLISNEIKSENKCFTKNIKSKEKSSNIHRHNSQSISPSRKIKKDIFFGKGENKFRYNYNYFKYKYIFNTTDDDMILLRQNYSGKLDLYRYIE